MEFYPAPEHKRSDEQRDDGHRRLRRREDSSSGLIPEEAVDEVARPELSVAGGFEGVPDGDGGGAGAFVADAVAEVAAEGASEAADADEQDN